MNTKTRMLLLVTATFALSVVAAIFGQVASQTNERMWKPILERSVDQAGARLIVPIAYRTVRLDKVALAQLLASAPMEFSRHVSQTPIIELPMPDGTLARFRFEESPVMEPAFAAKYPDWKTFRAQGIDDPAATSRFDWLPSGFHAIILSSSGTVLIDPYAEGNTADYITYWRRDAAPTTHPFVCGFKDSEMADLPKGGGIVPAVFSGATLRTYRLALSCTNEFAVAIGHNLVADTIQAEVVIMNRVNSIFERDVTVRMIMVNNTAVTYAGDNTSCGGPCNAGNDPFDNSNLGAIVEQNAGVLRTNIGASNYDMGHAFFSGSGGGTSGLVCNSSHKEKAASGLWNANESEAFAIGVVSHEMGHQFTATHTFNGIGASCSNQTRFHDSAYEPGSGATIEGYGGGTCGNQSMLPNTATDTFHIKSIEQMIAYTQSGAGNACAVQTSTGNTPPNVSGPGNFTIPKQTPFSLNASTTDVTRGTTYDWEEYDLDAGGVGTNAVPNTDADGTPRPILRIYGPVTKAGRTFPSLQYILNNANVPPPTITAGGVDYLTGELLPAISRTMVFQVVARRYNSINTAQSSVTIDGAATPFAVTSPNTAIIVQGGAFFTVTWNASGNAANVKISLSTDGGQTFPTVLAASTPNDGSQSVLIPNVGTFTGRIKIEAVGNIYFDISNTNFTIIMNS